MSPNVSILCVDDHSMVLDLLSRVLTAAGHRVETAAHGLDAWERFASRLTEFSLVISDHYMPHLDGLDLVRLLRDAHFRGPIIVHSNSIEPPTADAYRKLGADLIIPKLSSLGDVLNAVENALR